MREINFTIFEANDGSRWDYEHLARNREESLKNIENYFELSKNELSILIQDLQKAYETAHNPAIIDTSTVEARALIYMKNVCHRFIDKHKDLYTI